ncbi:hypothetical protein VTJ83DRAFT_1683 [Remersonia thermophila]|uniref:RNA helicase n=1 Tax=Remersonia thermophila TaxID=72144 RepID=A0ABR4DGT4_9PEZI
MTDQTASPSNRANNSEVAPFSTAELQATLPRAELETQATGQWVNPTPYNYAEFTPGKTGHEWEANTARYEWNDEYGDVGPEFPALELQLFGDPSTRGKKGIDFSKIAEIQVIQEGPTRIDPVATFDDAGLHPVMLQNVKLAGYDTPTPIQRYCLPAIHQGYDVIGIAQTGSGKTAAYLIPILSKLMGKAKKLAASRPNPAMIQEGVDPRVRAEPLVVIVAPTRELAVQIFNEARKFCYRAMLRPCVVYGGGSMRDQEMQLWKGCDVLVGTPGRLVHFLERPATLTLKRVRYMVIDEADEMLADDWKSELDKIMAGGEQEEGVINYMLFSATFPKAARNLAKAHLADTHVRIRVGRAGSTHGNIKQDIVWVDPSLKKQALLDFLRSLTPTRVIIFANTKRTVEELDDLLFSHELPCTAIHGDRNQLEREASMRAFRAGTCPILITTGVSSRGIDVRNVVHVINYDLPLMEYGGIEEYTHRIGRTGRIGHRGLATSFYSEHDEPIASVLTRTLLETNQEIPEFLQQYVPKNYTPESLKFEADSDFEEEGAGDDGNDDVANAWGNSWGAPDAGNTSGDQPVDESDFPVTSSGENTW